MDKVVNKSFSRSDGPFVCALDKALASFNVERQAYYSGTFVGNHVHRCLKVQCIHINLTLNYLNNAHQEKNIDTICASVTSTALQLNPSLHMRAQEVADRFTKAFRLFAISLTKTMSVVMKLKN